MQGVRHSRSQKAALGEALFERFALTLKSVNLEREVIHLALVDHLRF